MKDYPENLCGYSRLLDLPTKLAIKQVTVHLSQIFSFLSAYDADDQL